MSIDIHLSGDVWFNELEHCIQDKDVHGFKSDGQHGDLILNLSCLREWLTFLAQLSNTWIKSSMLK